MGLPVILDVGHSIDDFFAVAVAACSVELELLAVTTAQDDGGMSARIVRSLLNAYGRADVPVIAGSGEHHEKAFVAASTEALQSSHCLPQVDSNCDAVDFLNDLLARRSDVTVMATGPLTNFATLLHRFPSRAANIREIFFMGGWTTQALPDYNVRIDPEAAAYVLRHDIRIAAIGYEVTRGLRLLPEYFDRLESATTLGPRILHLLLRTWCETKAVSTPPMPDPVVVAYLCNQLPAHIETIRVGIRTAAGPGRGTMYQDNENGRQIRMFARVDASGYLDFLMSRVAPQQPPPVEELDLSRWRIELHTAYQLDHYQGWSLARTQHSAHIVALILSGDGEATVNHDNLSLQAGSVLYVPSNAPRSLRSEHGMNALWFYFDVLIKAANDELVPIETLPWPNTFTTSPDTELLAEIGKRVVKYWQYARPEGPLLCNAAVIELVAHLHTHTQEPLIRKGSLGQQAAQLAKRWIETRVTETITLEEIAQHASIDKFHLLRVFRESFGVPPLQYQRQLRMHQSLRLLKASELSISEIATAVGYASVTAFTRAFKRQYGVPPSEVR